MTSISFKKVKCNIWLFSYLLLMAACNSENITKIKEFNSFVSDTLSIELDSVTTTINPYYQYIETDSANLLTFFNAIDNSIYYYNFDTKDFIRKLSFEKEGPNGTGSRVTYFQIHHQDSIVIHSYYLGKILVFNNRAEVISVLDVSSNGMNDEFLPQSGVGFPVLLRDEYCYMTVSRTCNYLIESASDQKGILLKVNTQNNEKELVMQYPEVYVKDSQDLYWPRKLCNLYYTENKDKDFVMSFPMSDSVAVLERNGEIHFEMLAWPKKKLQKPIRRKDIAPGPMGEFMSYLSYFRYTDILYDPVKDVYLRKVELATPDDLLNNNQLKTEMFYLVADSAFNVLGYFRNSGSGQVFFTEKGMHQVKYTSGSEDFLTIKLVEYEIK